MLHTCLSVITCSWNVIVLPLHTTIPSVQLEEGEIPTASATTDDARAKALADAAEAERELKARRRMLGNIQFIGQLYKCGLLTDRIIHSCIVQLLNDELSPRPDDIECLCKLLITLGKQVWRRSAVTSLQHAFTSWS